MQSHQQERIDLKLLPSPIAIIGAVLAQGAIRCLDRQKREHRAADQKISPKDESAKSVGTTQL